MPRPASSLLVMAVAVVVAASIQAFSPPLGTLHLKPSLLCGIVVYYAMRREKTFAAVSAFVCGTVEDGFCGVPWSISTVVFAFAAYFAALRLKPQMQEGSLSCAVIGAALAPVLSFSQYVALRLGGGLAAHPAWFVAVRVAAMVPLGFLSSLAAAAALRALDWISANVGMEDEDEDGLSLV